MKRVFLVSLILSIFSEGFAQSPALPRGYSAEEREWISRGLLPDRPARRSLQGPPPYEELRCMAEWEEIQALTISWIGYPGILKQIVAAAKEETLVIILSESPQQTESYLLGNQGGPALDNLENVVILDAQFDSIWMRDYAANSVYGNAVDDLVLVDWIYNRATRVYDDASPQYIADYLGLDLYAMDEAPEDLVNTGGNWMSNGFGQAFASELIYEDNGPGNDLGASLKTPESIRMMLQEYMGIAEYITMPVLEHDIIHHIDMHMKLLDEQTLLVGSYPDGVADGPQINANVDYILSHFQTRWGTPYRIVHIPMPDSPAGLWPDSEPTASYYRTYTNSVFVNNTVILPLYREEYDTTALRIYGEALPGYRLVGIDCDNSQEPLIAANGAIHCITHSVGASAPLLMSHLPLPDTHITTEPYSVSAYIRHRDGIESASIFWKTAAEDAYHESPMVPSAEHEWVGQIPAQAPGTQIDYYLFARASSGRTQTRPMPAPEGHWSFQVLGLTSGVSDSFQKSSGMGLPYPNPAGAITCIPLDLPAGSRGSLRLLDAMGRTAKILREGSFPAGESRVFFDASELAAGVYTILLQTDFIRESRPIVIHH